MGVTSKMSNQIEYTDKFCHQGERIDLPLSHFLIAAMIDFLDQPNAHRVSTNLIHSRRRFTVHIKPATTSTSQEFANYSPRKTNPPQSAPVRIHGLTRVSRPLTRQVAFLLRVWSACGTRFFSTVPKPHLPAPRI
jgi:hypothetical protein